jgi:hypothetical protein
MQDLIGKARRNSDKEDQKDNRMNILSVLS